MMQKTNSDVARFRQQQELEEEAAKRGLYGPAVVANHESITARMERDAERINERVRLLLKQGKHEEAKALLFAYDPEQGLLDG